MLSVLMGIVNALNASDFDGSDSADDGSVADTISHETESQPEEEKGKDVEFWGLSYDVLSLVKRGQIKILSDIQGTMSPEALEQKKEEAKEIAQKREFLKQEVKRIASALNLNPIQLSRQLFETYYTSEIQRDVIEEYLNWNRPKKVSFLYNNGTFNESSRGDFYFDLAASPKNPIPTPVYWGEKDTSYFLYVFGDMPIDRWETRIKMIRRESPLESGDLPDHSYIRGMKSGNRALFERGKEFFIEMRDHVNADKNDRFRLLFDY